MISRLVCFFCFIFCLSGCAVDVTKEELSKSLPQSHNASVEGVVPGMTCRQVEEILGGHLSCADVTFNKKSAILALYCPSIGPAERFGKKALYNLFKFITPISFIERARGKPADLCDSQKLRIYVTYQRVSVSANRPHDVPEDSIVLHVRAEPPLKTSGSRAN